MKKKRNKRERRGYKTLEQYNNGCEKMFFVC